MILRNQNKGVAIFSNAFFYILSLNFLEAKNLLSAKSFLLVTPSGVEGLFLSKKGYRYYQG